MAIARTHQHRRTHCRRKDFPPSPLLDGANVAGEEVALVPCHQEVDHLGVESLKEEVVAVQKGYGSAEDVAVQVRVPCRSWGRHKDSLGHNIGGSSSPREVSVTNE